MKYVKEMRVVVAFGKEIEVTPCSAKHAEYFDTGYLVVSCSKCILNRRPTPTNTETRPTDG